MNAWYFTNIVTFFGGYIATKYKIYVKLNRNDIGMFKIPKIAIQKKSICKSRQNVLPTFSHYDVSPASHWSCFSRFYLGWSNLKNIFSNPYSLTETCSTRELLRIAEALALLSKTHLKSLHCLLSKEWDQSASNKEGAMIQTNCHKG